MLDPKAGEIGDVEKAPVVHRRKRNAPIREAVVLALQKTVQQRRAALAAIGGEAALYDHDGTVDHAQRVFKAPGISIRRRAGPVILLGYRQKPAAHGIVFG